MNTFFLALLWEIGERILAFALASSWPYYGTSTGSPKRPLHPIYQPPRRRRAPVRHDICEPAWA